MNKIIELLIKDGDFELEQLGVDILSIVENPAIGINFFAFSDQSFQATDEQVDELLELAEVMSDEHEPGEILTIEQDELMNLNFQDEPETSAEIQNKVRDAISLLGKRDADEEGVQVFKYTGPRAERKFCKGMLALSSRKYFTKESIDRMSDAPGILTQSKEKGTDIFKYMGGNNCKHTFSEYFMYRADGRTILVATGKTTGDAPKTVKDRGTVYSNNSDFQKIELESYNDYPKAVSNNAARGIELNLKQDNKCSTLVGKQRAQQLKKGENISLETIKRMYSYLSRAEVYYDEGDQTSCGYISYLLWGGKAGKRWAESKLKQLENLSNYEDFHFSALPTDKLNRMDFEVLDEDQKIVVGPIMIPKSLIPRRDAEGNDYLVYFSEETIKDISQKFFKLNYQNNTDVNHDNEVTTENTLLESWIVEDEELDKSRLYGFEPIKGSWYGKYKINNDETWQQIKDGSLNGFSISGNFYEREIK